MMKRLILLLLPLSLYAQEGIVFQDISWEAALSEAKKTKKLIFIDAYATWCQPCKALEKYTFTNEDVGNLFNNTFINVRFDMEKYPGLDLAEKYKVDLYPTLLFVDSNGDLVHRGCGALEPNDLLDLANTAMTPDQTLGSLSAKFKSGDRSIKMMDTYLQAMENACLDSEGVLASFFDGVPNEQLASDVYWHVLREYVFDLYDEKFLFLLDNQELFNARQDAQEVQNKIQDTFMLTFMELADSDQPLFAIKSIRYLAGQYEFEGRSELLDYLDFGEGELTENWDLYSKGVIGFMKPEIEDPDLILDVSWKFYLFVDNKERLLKALNWTKLVLDSNDPNPSAIDTYASLLYKLGKKEDAIKFSEQALQLAESWGEETQHYKYQLEKFKGR